MAKRRHEHHTIFTGLQQRAAGLSAGIELKNQYRLSQIDWLLQVGQLGQTSQAIKQLSH